MNERFLYVPKPRSVREAGISLLGGVARMMSERWDNRIPLAELRCRLLIVHGASDEVIPFHHAETLRNVRKENNLHCMFFPTQGTHNYFSYYRDYLRCVLYTGPHTTALAW